MSLSCMHVHFKWCFVGILSTAIKLGEISRRFKMELWGLFVIL
jgi:hypothetical protein